MSKAFTKEDVDPPERSGRVRSRSGLPPGAANYMTRRGADRLRHELEELRRAKTGSAERIAVLQDILASVMVVEAPSDLGHDVAFGATVAVRDNAGLVETYRIVGVDEMDVDPNAVSWISPIGKVLLAAKLGDRGNVREE